MSSVSLLLEIIITEIEESVMLFPFVILISQFFENDMFSSEMDPLMLFSSSTGLEKHWPLKVH